MILPILALIGGLALLAWSADIMIDGASGTVRYMGLPSLLIGMLIVGFGCFCLNWPLLWALYDGKVFP